ncbi:3-dehydroquinate synthase II family protein [Streptomyces gamaensis]|uniref:3-dehydroquinate synthase II family protein n=1 Tax=Streptomyces gamaensis TaxID=1763542 RepID=A0ABW0YU59_9ACTN
MKFGWIDIRSVSPEHRPAIVDAAIHARLDGIVDDKPDVLSTLPPTVRKVYLPAPGAPRAAEKAARTDAKHADKNAEKNTDKNTEKNTAGNGTELVLERLATQAELDAYRLRAPEDAGAAFVHVVDDPTLRLACASAQVLPYTLVKFQDPTKIPLEIVIAAADKSPGQIVCEGADLDEVFVILDVLEKGSEGVMFAPKDAGEVFKFAELLRARTPQLELSTLTVQSIEHSGLGERVCVDTCTHLEKDEGILVGSFAHGFVLCVSETHPLPYMPTRPFRVNAGALHSYVMGLDNRTNYLSELKTGSPILAVGTDGRTRRVVVGRAKVESRPLLTIRAVSEDGVEVALTLQDDWHVRILGPGAKVLNCTELKPGDQLLGYVATDRRHVGWAVDEFCLEK